MTRSENYVMFQLTQTKGETLEKPSDFDHIYMVDEEMVGHDHYFFFFKKAEKYLLNKGYVRISDPWEDFEGGRNPVYELKTALGLNYIATILKIPVMFGTGE